MNWIKLMHSIIWLVLFLAYIPLYNYSLADINTAIDAAPNIILGAFIKLLLAAIPLILVIIFFYSVISAFYDTGDNIRIA